MMLYIVTPCSRPENLAQIRKSIPSAYWEAWLYYRYDTVGTTEQRVAQCKEKNPMSSTSYPSLKHTNHYDEILKKKYL
jgi:hypothetical protein